MGEMMHADQESTRPRRARSDSALEGADLASELIDVDRGSVFEGPREYTKRVIVPGADLPKTVRFPQNLSQLECATRDQRTFLEYCESLDHIRREVNERLGPLDDVKSVFYPAAGIDSALPTRLFKSANLVVTAGSPPFVYPDSIDNSSDGAIDSLELKPPWGGDWVMGSGLNGKTVANYVLSNMIAAAEFGWKIENLSAFKCDKAFVDGEGKTSQSELVHGIIDYQRQVQGEEPLRRYVHVQQWFPDQADATGLLNWDFKNTWWFNQLDRLKPEAVVFKSANEAFVEGSCPPAFREAILDWLTTKGGFLFQGLSQYVDERHEFVDPDSLGVPWIEIDGVEYGYEKKVFVSKFPSPVG